MVVSWFHGKFQVRRFKSHSKKRLQKLSLIGKKDFTNTMARATNKSTAPQMKTAILKVIGTPVGRYCHSGDLVVVPAVLLQRKTSLVALF